MKSIIELLNENKKVSAWKLIETETESCELFYVLKNLETNRATKTKDINLTIYIDEEGTRGAANVVIYPHMNEEEIKKGNRGAELVYEILLLLLKISSMNYQKELTKN